MAEWPSASFRRMAGGTWGVASDKKLKPGDTVQVTKADETVVPVQIGRLVREIESDRYAGGAPTWLYMTAIEEEKEAAREKEASPWPPRLTFTPGGAVALWAKKHDLPVTRVQIEELLACFSLTYDGDPITVGDQPEDDTPF